MVEQQTQQRTRWSQLTYASFGPGMGDGWGFGPSRNVHPKDEEFVNHFVRGSLKPVQEVSDFLTSEEVEQLPIRMEYIPWYERAVFLHTRPAGKDSSGRQGNTFTHIYVDHAAQVENSTLLYPIQAYHSPDFRMPFLSKRVDGVELSEDNNGPDAGPHFDIDLAWEIIRSMFMGIDRTNVVWKVLDTLEAGEKLPVLVVNNSMDAQTWLTVISSLMSRKEARELFRFSTFERAATLQVDRYSQFRGRAVVAIPVGDAEAAARMDGVEVINTKDAGEGYGVGGTWASASKNALEHYPSHGELIAALDAQPPLNPDRPRLGDAMRQLNL